MDNVTNTNGTKGLPCHLYIKWKFGVNSISTDNIHVFNWMLLIWVTFALIIDPFTMFIGVCIGTTLTNNELWIKIEPLRRTSSSELQKMWALNRFKLNIYVVLFRSVEGIEEKIHKDRYRFDGNKDYPEVSRWSFSLTQAVGFGLSRSAPSIYSLHKHTSYVKRFELLWQLEYGINKFYVHASTLRLSNSSRCVPVTREKKRQSTVSKLLCMRYRLNTRVPSAFILF